jgi:ribose transport system substrate-binding protein
MKAKQAGVVVGMFSSDLAPANQKFRDFFAGVNDTMAGEAAGEAFLKKFPDGATIVEVGGQAGHDAQIKRHDGFNKKIKGTKIEVIDYKTPQQWSTAEAMAITEDLIVKHGKKIQGVFCHWDNGATGVAQALKAANMMDGMFIVGVDGNRAGFDQVRKGTQSVTIMQNFEVMSKKSMELARAVIDGKKVEPINFVQLDIVDLKNIDQFTPPEW